MDLSKPCVEVTVDEVTVDEAREKGRAAVRWATHQMHNAKETTP